MKNIKIEAALRAIAKRNGGRLVPEQVVESARPKSSPLHGRFTWDDGEAADKWRIHQARMLINVCVEVLGDGLSKSPVFVSLSVDRGSGTGYRLTTTVMGDSEMRAQLLKDALSDLNTFQKKYQDLKELAEVFSALRKVRAAA